MTLYNGDGYHGSCEGCGADGFWSIVADADEATIIKCECGHEDVVMYDEDD